MDEILRAMLKWSVLAAAVCTVLFILQYTAYSPWWRDKVARMVVFRDLTTLLSLVPLIGALFFHLTLAESRVAGWVYTSAIVLVSVIMITCMILWHQVGKSSGPDWEDPVLRLARNLRKKARLRK